MIGSAKVRAFEYDARARATRGLRPNMRLLLEALDDAVKHADHIGLTVLRRRVEEAQECVAPGAFYAVLEQLKREIQVCERLAIAQTVEQEKIQPQRWLNLAREALRQDNAIEKSQQWAF